MISTISGRERSMYLQVANFICRKIIMGEWKEGTSVPAAADLSISLEINPETGKQAIVFLQKKNVLTSADKDLKIAKGAVAAATALLKEEFINADIPFLAERLELLQISTSGLHEMLDAYITKNKSGKK